MSKSTKAKPQRNKKNKRRMKPYGESKTTARINSFDREMPDFVQNPEALINTIQSNKESLTSFNNRKRKQKKTARQKAKKDISEQIK